MLSNLQTKSVKTLQVSSAFLLAIGMLLFAAGLIVFGMSYVPGTTFEQRRVLFVETKANFEGRKAQIRTAKIGVINNADEHSKTLMRQTLFELQQDCIFITTVYNRASAKPEYKVFKARGLPDTLEPGECA